jgi:YggT family protein
MIVAALWLFDTVIGLYIFVIFAMVIMSWLVQFNVVNPHNPFVRQVEHMLFALTNPVLGPIRRMIPSLGGLDISPIVVVLALGFIQRVVHALVYSAVYGQNPFSF